MKRAVPRMVHFDRPGISYIFCNHPSGDERCRITWQRRSMLSRMAKANSNRNVPYGRYLLHVWSEGTGQRMHSPRRAASSLPEFDVAGVIRVPAVNGTESGAQDNTVATTTHLRRKTCLSPATVIAERHTMKIEKISSATGSRKENTSD